MNDFDPEQDSCDARQSLLDAPSSSRIERHTEEFLSRALALRPPIAFVGAGLDGVWTNQLARCGRRHAEARVTPG